MNEARKECQRRGAKLLIVDTIGQFANLRGDGENDAAAALQVMKPLQEVAASGLGVIVVRHERKSGGDVGDSGRGSSAFAGAVDVVLSIRRLKGNTRQTRRVIQSLSRFSETPNELVIELTVDGYSALGEMHTVQTKEAEEPILAATPSSEEDAICLKDLIEASGVKRATAQRAIKNLLAEAKIMELGSGKRGDPFRYWKPEIHSAQTASLYGQKETGQEQMVETVL